jgi:ATP-dependent helicase YprA (DUF1998 family)
MKLPRLFKSRPASACFCDECSQVIRCDVSQRMATIRDQDLTRYLLHR